MNKQTRYSVLYLTLVFFSVYVAFSLYRLALENDSVWIANFYYVLSLIYLILTVVFSILAFRWFFRKKVDDIEGISGSEIMKRNIRYGLLYGTFGLLSFPVVLKSYELFLVNDSVLIANIYGIFALIFLFSGFIFLLLSLREFLFRGETDN